MRREGKHFSGRKGKKIVVVVMAWGQTGETEMESHLQADQGREMTRENRGKNPHLEKTYNV